MYARAAQPCQPGIGVASRTGRKLKQGEPDLQELIYDRAMETGQFFDEEFKSAVRLAGARARIETLRAGVPVFYRDAKQNVDVMEHPSGRKFEIRFLDGAPGDRNYEVLRELDETAA